MYEKKVAKYDGVSRFAHKLQQYYKFYLIASQVIFSAKASTSFRSPFDRLSPSDFFQLTGYTIFQHTASQPRQPTAHLSLLVIYTSMVAPHTRRTGSAKRDGIEFRFLTQSFWTGRPYKCRLIQTLIMLASFW